MGSDTTRQRNGTARERELQCFAYVGKNTQLRRGGRVLGREWIHRNRGARQGVPLRGVPSSFKQLSNGFGIRNFRACEMTLLVSVTRYSWLGWVFSSQNSFSLGVASLRARQSVWVQVRLSRDNKKETWQSSKYFIIWLGYLTNMANGLRGRATALAENCSSSLQKIFVKIPCTKGITIYYTNGLRVEVKFLSNTPDPIEFFHTEFFLQSKFRFFA